MAHSSKLFMFEEDQTENYGPLERLRHSAAHIMADAVQSLFPGTKLAIGPAIETGFYYDFDAPRPFTEEDLRKIEAKMQEIVERDEPFRREEVKKQDAIEFFKKRGESYKLEIINAIDSATVSYFTHGDFVDLCRGPHLESTGKLKAFKLLSVAGAYWRGDEKNKMLQRIYGTAFPDKKLLDAYLHQLKEAELRDHRKLGKELDLFSSMEEEGPGLILWHPKGARIRQVIEDLWREEHRRAGYELVYTPHMAKLDLWKTSGHVDFYSENMFSPMEVEGQEYEIKPMNCPFHVRIFNSKGHSYRELPIRLAELGTVYRFERSGVIHGLLRVRGFTQDDAHLFCRPDQLQAEVEKVLQMTMSFLGKFGFNEFELYLSTRPQKSVGSDENWDLATKALEGALKAQKIAFQIDPGEGVFYGPKIDLKIKDTIGRLWQCSTVQVDFNNPERFNIQYVAEDGSRQRPIMIHRALMGSLERFFGILIEHFAGAFPTWLAPVQVALLPISDAQNVYAEEICQRLRAEGIRAHVDQRSEKLGAKIRESQLQKVPHMLVLGAKEQEAGLVSLRSRSQGDRGQMKFDEFLGLLKKDITERV
jgi:threonyl-tRNA synthetase